jgi:thioesterase domain-containing protein
LLHVGLRRAGIDAHLVIQGNSMHFERPITADFSARSALAQPQAWEPFMHALQRKGRARIGVAVALACAGSAVARLDGEFVAMGPALPQGRLPPV